MAFHQGDGRPETAYSQRIQGQGESSGPLDEITTYDSSEELDEGEFQRLMNKWLQ